jgi:hypothetical protein
VSDLPSRFPAERTGASLRERTPALESISASDPWTRLRQWQEWLGSHYAELAESRKEPGWPVFVLEHDLDEATRRALIKDVRSCSTRGPAREISLPWLIYAAEIGYEYSGYEYWQTFEANTPGWQTVWRDQIRTRFAAFGDAYHGARPAGDWARHFNIIAWPITHGVLPQDLQRQLAALLYHASTTFRSETFSSAETLGAHLQAHCEGCSSRFRQFAENGPLLGQIALALLVQQDHSELLDAEHAVVLHGSTLLRIVSDLSRQRDAKQWLADARAAARYRVRGLARIPLRQTNGKNTPGDQSGDDQRAAAVPRPRWLLREIRADHWQVRVEFPNLGQIAKSSPAVRDLLSRSQGRAGGPSGPILARGRILSESWPGVRLEKWPSPHTLLLTFQGAPPELAAVLQSSFQMGAANQWLFLIGSDGQARELVGRVLRPGESYLLLQPEAVRSTPAGSGISIVHVNCDGIYGLRIDVPESVTDAVSSVLRVLGLEVATTLDVWPVGLPVADWSGAGRVEAVADSPLVLALRADRRITHIGFKLGDGPRATIPVVTEDSGGELAFLKLPCLEPGTHHLSLAAFTTDDVAPHGSPSRDQESSRLRGDLEIIIRHARAQELSRAGVLSFALHPAAPSLEDLWEDRVELHVAAPGQTKVRCLVTLSDATHRQLLNRNLVLPLPLSSQEWRREFLPVRRAAEDLYDDAQSCTVHFDAGVLGRARMVAERDFTALRWVAREKGHRLYLVDSLGSSDLTVTAYSCAEPLTATPRPIAGVIAGLPIENSGALLIARSQGHESATVVVPKQIIRDFTALSGARPTLPSVPRQAAILLRLATTCGVWERARVTGSSLAEARRSAVVEAVTARIMSVVAGGRWADAEHLLQARGLDQVAVCMRNLVASRPDERAVPVLLTERLDKVANASLAEVEEVFLDVLNPFIKAKDLEDSARFALRLAGSPSMALHFATTTHEDVSERRSLELMEHLLQRPVLARAARYTVVATRALLSSGGVSSGLLPWRA